MKTNVGNFSRTDSLPIQLAAYIRNQIVAGRLQPGERLIEQSLATECNVSRVPLREAMRILAVEGLIMLTPHRGAYVTPTSPAELIDLFEARAALEGAAAMTAARKQDSSSLAAMAQTVANMKKAIKLNDHAQYYQLAGDFHRALVLASANSILMRLYEQIRAQLTRYQAVMAAIPELPTRSISEHAQIVRAIKAGDGVAARRHAEQHILGLVEQYAKASVGSQSREDQQWTKTSKRKAG